MLKLGYSLIKTSCLIIIPLHSICVRYALWPVFSNYSKGAYFLSSWESACRVCNIKLWPKLLRHYEAIFNDEVEGRRISFFCGFDSYLFNYYLLNTNLGICSLRLWFLFFLYSVFIFPMFIQKSIFAAFLNAFQSGTLLLIGFSMVQIFQFEGQQTILEKIVFTEGRTTGPL